MVLWLKNRNLTLASGQLRPSAAWQVTTMGPSSITHLSSLGSIVTLVADDETAAQRYEITGSCAFLLLLRLFLGYDTACLSVGFPEAAPEQVLEYKPSI